MRVGRGSVNPWQAICGARAGLLRPWAHACWEGKTCLLTTLNLLGKAYPMNGTHARSITRFVAVMLVTLFVVLPPLWAAGGAGDPPPGPLVGATLTETITQITGVAISPLLGMSAVGAYRYFKTPEEQRDRLPWYCHPMVWLAGLAVAGAAAAKDTLGVAVPTSLKKPFDLLEAVENQASGLVGMAAFLPITMASMGSFISTQADGLVTGGTFWGGFLPMAVIDSGAILGILLIPLAMAVYAVVWLLSNAINVLILLSPFAVVDAALKGFRASILGLLTLLGFINPWLGALLSLIIIVVACLLAGWAFRLSTYGVVFIWDFLTLRRTRFKVDRHPHRVFTARRIEQVPIRTYGTLSRPNGGSPVLSYRPWLVGTPRTVELPAADYAVGAGILFSTVVQVDPASGKARDWLTLPPRFRGHEQALADHLQTRVVPLGLRKGARWMVDWTRELLGLADRPGKPVCECH